MRVIIAVLSLLLIGQVAYTTDQELIKKQLARGIEKINKDYYIKVPEVVSMDCAAALVTTYLSAEFQALKTGLNEFEDVSCAQIRKEPEVLTLFFRNKIFRTDAQGKFIGFERNSPNVIVKYSLKDKQVLEIKKSHPLP